ncbi:hypothetical protein [Pseudomonas phage LY218]|uniref:Uncharacterized protein n=2 Tax=Litunavirus Ab09 TaxID=1920765 RepID=A0A0A7NPR1_9CAUD|nr:hypothetical protein ACQ21_gp21 [Pseudomonas phage Pa2]AIZ94863.1 hypothetical protein [Pseudomonas phage Pa2]AIZ94954.1 hypothetical protein [Pseudomonas phage phi176]QHZ59543.1 hypothetical protein [Pseudomonas phage LY218]
MNVAAWLEEGEWKIFYSEDIRFATERAKYQIEQVDDLNISPVLLRQTMADINKIFWFKAKRGKSKTDQPSSVNVDMRKYGWFELLSKEDMPRELEALLVVYGLM